MTAPAESIEEFRARVRAWLPGNLDRRPATAPDPYSEAHIAEHRAIQRRLFDSDLAGLTWPVEYGGRGLPAAYERAFAEEAADFVTPYFGILSTTTFGSCVPTMLRHATPEYLHRHVPRVLRGEELWCQFFSEPAAGSDLAGIQTRATRRDDGSWTLDGAKIWSSLAHLADWGMCLARTDWDVPKHQGLTWFGVPCDAPGLTVRPIRQIGGGSEFCEEFLDGVIVPDSDRIGEIDRGWSVTSTLLVFERGAGRPGATETPDDPGPLAPDLVALARRTGRLGDAAVLRAIASAHVESYAVAQLEARIATLSRQGRADSGIAAYGKLAKAAATAARARTALDLGGADAVLWDPEQPGADATAHAFLESKKPSVAGGTEQMQRNGVAERVLGLPREPAADAKLPFSEVLRRAREWRQP
ncbi:acyl-CoA dehydrogenase family protein [Nocardia sp. alder85J]|uniref:acyl-CoA dehydrogenase family protein n=1 Tax=Nocardia sp. alder85J TaxID=2862949 RepID=UPI001CD7EA7E|nr:acyl-CoA dehydrogenase family protein [Nocardia sp. alder85J]MCX4092354.1 acyl-CoA dehydrogenase family protein [Nocardia sp. alder85J]